jgi:hypothetical protein
MKMKMYSVAFLALASALAITPAAIADSFSASPTGIPSPTQTIDFSEIALAQNAVVTNQYAGLGITFSPNVYYDPETGFGSIQANDIGNFSSTGLGPVNPVTFTFSTPLTAAAFSFDADFTPYLFQALLNGTVVDSFVATVGDTSPDYYGFTNDDFNQITITQDGAGGGPYWLASNIEFGSDASVIPEPSSIYLLGSGLACLAGFVRRKVRV